MTPRAQFGLASLPLALACAHAVSAQQLIGYVNSRDAVVTGASDDLDGRAVLTGSASVTAKDHTAPITLGRGGIVRVCQTSVLHLTESKGFTTAAPLLLSLDRGAVEIDMTGTPSDAIMTPDLRFAVRSQGPLDLRMRVARNGDTCVENRGFSAPTLAVSDPFGEAMYELQPNQHVLFEHGSVHDVVDHETTPCGCPDEKGMSIADALLAPPAPIATVKPAAAAPAPPPAPAPTPTAPASPPQAAPVAVVAATTATAPPVAVAKPTPPPPAAVSKPTSPPAPAVVVASPPGLTPPASAPVVKATPAVVAAPPAVVAAAPPVAPPAAVKSSPAPPSSTTADTLTYTVAPDASRPPSTPAASAIATGPAPVVQAAVVIPTPPAPTPAAPEAPSLAAPAPASASPPAPDQPTEQQVAQAAAEAAARAAALHPFPAAISEGLAPVPQLPPPPSAPPMQIADTLSYIAPSTIPGSAPLPAPPSATTGQPSLAPAPTPADKPNDLVHAIGHFFKKLFGRS